ncbi:MAG TPA: phosphatase PAP2 family protein [Tepidisphaeraceae bacterium]|nr:phosphatase PAP2 family protein [Tepidisphaeraceae bacterium]
MPLRRLLEIIGQYGGFFIVAILIVVAGAWAFIALTDAVREGDTGRFDLSIEHYVADHPGPAWLEEVGRDITALGGVAVIALVVLAVIGYLLLRGAYGAMWLVIIATGSGLLLSTALKLMVHRDRPAIIAHRSAVYTTSFPSGHSMLSAVVYLTLGALLARLAKERVIKFYFLAIALILTGLVGISRVYMGVHWPTDVLAGWTAGLAWAALCWAVTRYLQRRGAVERDS